MPYEPCNLGAYNAVPDGALVVIMVKIKLEGSNAVFYVCLLLFFSAKKKQIHIPWTIDDKEALFCAFGPFLKGSSNKLPGKADITKAQSEFNILQKRTWLNIKFQLKNMKKRNS